jgi:hypothetical protein
MESDYETYFGRFAQYNLGSIDKTESRQFQYNYNSKDGCKYKKTSKHLDRSVAIPFSMMLELCDDGRAPASLAVDLTSRVVIRKSTSLLRQSTIRCI